jgi:DNA-binding beta-propeller fold protein YncE
MKILMVAFLLLNLSCLKDKVPTNYPNNFPENVGLIIGTNCSTTGCHTTQSSNAAGGISMSSWDELMLGGNNNNAIVIPYSPDQSTLFYAINTDENIGPTLFPTMPVNAPALSKEQVMTVYNWIMEGAPNSQGEVKFSENENRSMVYVLNAQCNKISVIDESTGLIMRYVSIGTNEDGMAEVIKVSPDKSYYYTLHQSGKLQKFDALSNSKIGQVNLVAGFWRSMSITSDSKIGVLTDWSGNSNLAGGKIALVDLISMSLINLLDAPEDSIYFPYGIAINDLTKTIYSSCQTGNFIYKIDFSNFFEPIFTKIPLNPSEYISFTSSPYRPGQIILKEDKYYVLCENSNEVRIFSSASDELLEVLEVGESPQSLIVSDKHNVIAVACMEDQLSFEKVKGSIVFFDLNTNDELTRIYSGYQPKAMVVDQSGDQLYIVNRNADMFSPDKPHHYSGCEGNNGYLTIVNLQTKKIQTDYKVELNVNPFSIDLR